LTDSGGIQEEATVLGVPCLTLRDTTERPVTVTHGTNRVIGSDPGRILGEALQTLAHPPRRDGAPPLWDGHAAERIVEVRETHCGPKRWPGAALRDDLGPGGPDIGRRDPGGPPRPEPRHGVGVSAHGLAPSSAEGVYLMVRDEQARFAESCRWPSSRAGSSV